VNIKKAGLPIVTRIEATSGNPAVFLSSKRPVAFRPNLTIGLAFMKLQELFLFL
jgi:hypothetical protein